MHILPDSPEQEGGERSSAPPKFFVDVSFFFRRALEMPFLKEVRKLAPEN